MPYLFGNDFLYAEAYVYALAKKMMPEYEGGFWHFIHLPDGGGYMMPDGDRFHMVNGANWFDRFFWQEEPLWRLIFEAGEAGRAAPVQVRALEQWMIPNKLENVI